MKCLVLGSGGREHALAWKLGQSSLCEAVYLHPGNAGTSRSFPSLGTLPIDDSEALIARATELGISLVVIGPETLLDQGYGDLFRAKGFQVVGPNRAASRLETSKVFSKLFMQRAGVPTAGFSIANSRASLLEKTGQRWPTVLKLDGLAAGKGVVVAATAQEVEAFAERIWSRNEFGPGPHQVLVEEFLPGVEVSYLGFCDGTTFLPLASATDYKRVGDGNRGHNTGGMGAISPSPFLTHALNETIRERIVNPVLAQMQAEAMDFRGILYIGLMVDSAGNPSVLEFNTRFGDPETQAILMRFESDLAVPLQAVAEGKLASCPPPIWDPATAVYVVGASEGYPNTPRLGDAIEGIPQEGNALEESHVFYSGVKASGDSLSTAGGRVLGVGALGEDAHLAREKVYRAFRKLKWQGMHYRTDIGLT